MEKHRINRNLILNEELIHTLTSLMLTNNESDIDFLNELKSNVYEYSKSRIKN